MSIGCRRILGCRQVYSMFKLKYVWPQTNLKKPLTLMPDNVKIISRIVMLPAVSLQIDLFYNQMYNSKNKTRGEKLKSLRLQLGWLLLV